MKKVTASFVALAMVAGAGSAQAATFDYSFTSKFFNGQNAVGSGTFEADDTGTGDGSWNISGATGSFTTDPDTEYATTYNVLGAPVDLWGSKQRFTLGQKGVVSADFALQTSNLFFTLTGRGDATSGFSASQGEVGGPMTLSITPASAGAVPEPATWGLMLVGFAAAGAALRRRKSVDRFATV